MKHLWVDLKIEHVCISVRRAKDKSRVTLTSSSVVLQSLKCSALLSPIPSFAFKMHQTTVANIFTHDVRSNLSTIFLERRLKLDALFLSGWAGREDKLEFATALSATERMTRDIFYFRNSLWVCTPDAAIHSPWALPPRGSAPAGQPCCSPCRRWHPKDMVRVIWLHTNTQDMGSLRWAVRWLKLVFL